MGEAATTQGLRHIAAQEAPVWVMAAGRCFRVALIRRQQMLFYPWQLFFPTLFISLTMLSFQMLGDGLRDALDPRTRD